VADQITQMNMANALLTHDAVKSRGASPEEVVAASGLTEQDVATVLTLQPWVAMMKQACAQIALAPGQHLNDDGLWPPAPDGLAALAARF